MYTIQNNLDIFSLFEILPRAILQVFNLVNQPIFGGYIIQI